ncbi:MAG: hypothetical protein IPN85_08485, partial [Flavobacteriales bacterium]|nr:hypothetical protein [Flavobacteriales bacterium]
MEMCLAELVFECQQMNFGTNTTWTSTEIAAYNAQQTDHMTDCSAACTTATRLAEYEAEIVAAYPGISPTDLTCLRNAMQASCLQTCSDAYPTVTTAPVALPNTDLDNAGMIEFGHPQLTAGACSGGGYNMTGCIQAACLTWVGEVEPAGAPDETVALTCEEIQATAMLQELLVQRSLQLQEQLDQFTANYLTECAVPDNIEDNLHVEFLSGKHHYTLYYYDRAGSLMSTVPPNDEPLQLDNVSAPTPPATWPTTDIIYPERTLYRYNSLGQLVMQKTPDGGQTLMAYDRLGRLRFSQNDKQLGMTPTPAYSYTKYDGLGRVVEVGESTAGNAGNDLFDDLVYQLLKAQDQYFPTSGTHRTLTTYTDALTGLTFSNGQGQRYLVNRVSWSMSDQDGNTATTFDQVVTAYSYDPHGNVDWLVHQLPDVGQRFISYDYDLVSGHVRQLRYNEGFVDQFFQRYSYDEDGRILNAQTSADGVVWDNDARYSYYAHGPLKRTVLGEDQVQGIDHTYTIQGWLKGINAADLTNGDDPSKDGFAGPNVKVGKDAFGMMLSYFDGDFNHPGSPFHNDPLPVPNTAGIQGRGKHSLYNGNIAAWSWQGQLAETASINAANPFDPYASNAPLAMRYRYDVLNRLRADQPRAYSGATWADDATNAFATSYRYDANGNFYNAVAGAVTRKDATGGAVDNIGYTYGVPFHPNALASISEGTNGAGADLAEGHTYTYDAIGQLTNESWNSVNNQITWTPYGKVSQVALHDGTYLRFAYDAAGHRILKAHVTNLNSGLTVAPAPVDEFTYYIHDAQGNLLTTYRRSFTASGVGQITDEMRVAEQPLYGSARLGLRTPDNLLVRKLIWTGNTPQVAPLPRVGKAELERLDIPARVAKLKAGDPKVTAGSNFTQTRTYATSPVDKTIPAITAQTTNPGTQCINVHRAEDRFGATVFTATTTKQSGVHTLYLMDRNGDLLWNSNGIRAASGAVTHSCQVPGNPMQYYLFTIGDDQKPYVHLIDLSVTVITQGAVLLKNQLLDLGSGIYDRGLAVIDDRTSYGRAMLYAVRRVSGQYTLMGLDLETFTQNGGGQLAPLAASITGSSIGQHGLLQISPDGRELAMVSGSGAPMGMFMWATANIHRYSLSADHTQATFLATYSEGNAAFHYMDYSPAGQYLYFVKSGITLGGATHEVKRQNLTTTVVTSVVRDYGGDIRRTKHGEMLVATPAFLYTDEAFRILGPNTATPTWIWGSFTGIDAKAEGAIGLQPLVYELLPVISTRTLNYKRYELTDHLGNVRAVVSDRKLCDNSALPTQPTAYRAEVLNQTDFYPFGMISRSTTASGGDYRFGFNGKENDNEVHGAPGTFQDYGMRAYDPRLGRFASVDPLTTKFPYLSPYQFAGNKPIWCYDLDGLEDVVYWKHTIYENGYQRRMIRTLNWSDLFPGEANGPLGHGSLYYASASAESGKATAANSQFFASTPETAGFAWPKMGGSWGTGSGKMKDGGLKPVDLTALALVMERLKNRILLKWKGFDYEKHKPGSSMESPEKVIDKGGKIEEYADPHWNEGVMTKEKESNSKVKVDSIGYKDGTRQVLDSYFRDTTGGVLDENPNLQLTPPRTT